MLAAGQATLTERGTEGFTVQEISKRSGLSVGAIYARFENKDELFRAVQDRMLSQIEAEQNELFDPVRFESMDARAVIAGAIASAIEIMREHERPLRALILRSPSDERVMKRGEESSQELQRKFTELVLTRRDAIQHPDPVLAADIAFRMVYGTATHRVAFGETFESPVSFDWEVLTDELTRACAGYLLNNQKN